VTGQFPPRGRRIPVAGRGLKEVLMMAHTCQHEPTCLQCIRDFCWPDDFVRDAALHGKATGRDFTLAAPLTPIGLRVRIREFLEARL
jgi:hypothetical protein